MLQHPAHVTLVNTVAFVRGDRVSARIIKTRLCKKKQELLRVFKVLCKVVCKYCYQIFDR